MKSSSDFSTPVMRDLEGYFTLDQINRMINEAASPRDRLLVLVGWRTGRRISEILGLKKKHIDFDKGLILFYILKKRRKDYPKLKPVDDDTLHQLEVYTSQMDPEAYVFGSPYIPGEPLSRRQAYNIISKTAKKAGIRTVGVKEPHPHHLRHSFAVHFIKNCPNPTIAIKVLQSILEHSNIGNTATYLQFGQEEERKQLNKIFAPKEEGL